MLAEAETLLPKKTGQSRIDSSREVVRDDASNEAHDDDSQDSDCSEEADAEIQEIYDSVGASRFVRGTWVTLKPLFGIMHSQLLEATLLLLDFVLLQHVAMPYVGRIECEEHVGSQEAHSTMTSFSEKSMKIHLGVINALETFINPCTTE